MNWAEIAVSSTISTVVVSLALVMKAAVRERMRYKAWHHEYLRSPARSRGTTSE